MKTRWQVILILLAVFFIGAILILSGYSWFQSKMARVEAGTARPTFPYSDYSQEELEKLYPQYVNVDVATIQTPEETYSKFLNNIKDENVDEAAKLFSSKNKEQYTEVLKEMKSKKELLSLYKKLPSKLEKVSCYDTICTYKADIDSFIRFLKDSKGIWLIESL